MYTKKVFVRQAQFSLSADFNCNYGLKLAPSTQMASGGTFKATFGEKSFNINEGFVAVEAGEYTISFDSNTQKSSSVKVNLAYNASSLKLINASLSQDVLTAVAKDGTLDSIKVYKMGGNLVEASGNDYKLVEVGKYIIVAEKNGNTEAYIFNYDVAEQTIPTPKKGCKSSADSVLIILVGIMLVTAVFVTKRTHKGGNN